MEKSDKIIELSTEIVYYIEINLKRTISYLNYFNCAEIINIICIL